MPCGEATGPRTPPKPSSPQELWSPQAVVQSPHRSQTWSSELNSLVTFEPAGIRDVRDEGPQGRPQEAAGLPGVGVEDCGRKTSDFCLLVAIMDPGRRGLQEKERQDNSGKVLHQFGSIPPLHQGPEHLLWPKPCELSRETKRPVFMSLERRK